MPRDQRGVTVTAGEYSRSDARHQGLEAFNVQEICVGAPPTTEGCPRLSASRLPMHGSGRPPRSTAASVVLGQSEGGSGAGRGPLAADWGERAAWSRRPHEDAQNLCLSDQ